ncbi:helix-turn-helix domain-containing protein [Sediminispirochaeta smaragdinae]|uniref:HTH cro/C1-type domain-containing protein n=1 Tax=Sediminispirochaeta smaragdinae (strain DSM 11293 / JCM 15392 / SEBR 4228) TaxID=573413 RepID=E1R0W8_SEDSS|nr:XRE family transcriptional regulator [Sediminispirochaeta smaragdinae]ADK80217.1 protein of unknown function DUF955 [Sediminispirochaeta smaragdinae DSM 11293]
MAIEDIGANIRRIMKIKGYSIAKLSARMGVGTATISNILNGRSEPKSSTLLKFCNALEVGLPDILADAPKLQSLRFRTNSNLSAREKAERDQMLYETAQWLKNYNTLEDLLNVKPEYGFKDLGEADPIRLANIVREKLGLTDSQPIVDLPAEIEKAGIKLYLHSFGFKKTFGLSVADIDMGPAIVVNSEKDISIERRIFTIAHELGHLLMHRGSYNGEETVEDKGSAQEKEADLFAGEFLLPTSALKREWSEAIGLDLVDRVLKIKKIYRVSYQVVLMRLSQLNPQFESPQIYIRFNTEFQEKYHHNLKNHYEPEAIEEPEPLSDFDLIEDHYAALVLKAYSAGGISMSKAGEMLGKSTMQMRKFLSAWKEIELNE